MLESLVLGVISATISKSFLAIARILLGDFLTQMRGSAIGVDPSRLGFTTK